MKPNVIIPASQLDLELVKLAACKNAAWLLLRELELAAYGESHEPIGAWRHDPAGWMSRRNSSK